MIEVCPGHPSNFTPRYAPQEAFGIWWGASLQESAGRPERQDVLHQAYRPASTSPTNTCYFYMVLMYTEKPVVF
jgi:hypothetical protein